MPAADHDPPAPAAEHHRAARRAAAQGNLLAAAEQLARAVDLDPARPGVLVELAEACALLGRDSEAVAAYVRQVERAPDDAETHARLAGLLQRHGQGAAAEFHARRALALRPTAPDSGYALGAALTAQGRVEEAIAAYRRAIAAAPAVPDPYAGLLYALHFSPAHGPAEVLAEHLAWAARFADPLARDAPPHANSPDADRRLRLGYVSSNFSDHPVGRNIEPVLANHDRGAFEVVCYATSFRAPDDATRRMRAAADHWRDAAALDDERLARLVRDDGIDILIDLTLHLAGGRLLAFARRPAPVQVTHMGYPATTGLRAIDYRITDPHLDPPGAEPFSAESLVRLPHTFWCYPPHAPGSPDVAPPPAARNGFISFGQLNNLMKASDPAVDLWCRVLRAVPGSRFVLYGGNDDGTKQRTAARFARHGIAGGRLEFVGRLSPHDYLAAYRRIDVALDSFPYGGHMTSIDAAWMGVPTVTLPGRTSVSRAGASLAANLGLPGLVAATPEQYVAAAIGLACDLARLTALRREMRGRLRRSPIMDAAGYARALEAAYRTMWRTWCAARP